jgi:hypothetical protein
MNEEIFLRTVYDKAGELGINPLLLISGIEGLYMFKDTPLNQINYDFLDSLILTIMALRIGDGFHSIAEKNLEHPDTEIKWAAIQELTELNGADIAASGNATLQSFAGLINGKSPVRRYHEKALEVAALEIGNTQQLYRNNSISTIVLALCQTELKDLLEESAFFQR